MLFYFLFLTCGKGKHLYFAFVEKLLPGLAEQLQKITNKSTFQIIKHCL